MAIDPKRLVRMWQEAATLDDFAAASGFRTKKQAARWAKLMRKAGVPLKSHKRGRPLKYDYPALAEEAKKHEPEAQP